jgi:cytochrome c2
VVLQLDEETGFAEQSQRAAMGGGGNVNVNEFMIRGVLHNVAIIILFVMPLVTMRTYAEEKRSGTMELLLTSPITDLEIIVGKFLGAMGLFAAMLLVTAIDIAILFRLGNPELKPEKSQQTTLGFVFEPVSGTSLGMDFFQIDLKNLVSNGVPIGTILSPALQAQYANLVTRQATCPPSQFVPGAPCPITAIDQIFVNLGETKITGFDVDARYTSPTSSWGRIKATLNGTYYIKYDASQPDGSFAGFVSNNFQAVATGEYDLYCSEYCGTGHSDMLSKVVVHQPGGFEKWLEDASNLLARLPPVEAGRELFVRNGCTACHTTDGTPKVGPSLKAIYGQTHAFTNASPAQVDDNYIRESIVDPMAKIREGYQGVMPTFKGRLKDKEITALIEYIKSLK